MKTKKIFCISLFLGIIMQVQGQEPLSKAAIELKLAKPYIYKLIEKLSVEKWEENIDLVNHSINEQTDAFLRVRSAQEQPNYVWEYSRQASRDFPSPIGTIDWIGKESFYNIILKQYKDVVQPVVSISMKGFTIGEKLEGTASKFTTVGGVEGSLKANTLNDGTIFSVSFESSDKENMPVRISDSKALNCISAINTHYKVELEETAAGYLPRGNRRFQVNKGNFSFFIELLKENQKDGVFSLKVSNLSLNFINIRERKERINSDF
jgi:hypothetical protein